MMRGFLYSSINGQSGFLCCLMYNIVAGGKRGSALNLSFFYLGTDRYFDMRLTV